MERRLIRSHAGILQAFLVKTMTVLPVIQLYVILRLLFIERDPTYIQLEI